MPLKLKSIPPSCANFRARPGGTDLCAAYRSRRNLLLHHSLPLPVGDPTLTPGLGYMRKKLVCCLSGTNATLTENRLVVEIKMVTCRAGLTEPDAVNHMREEIMDTEEKTKPT